MNPTTRGNEEFEERPSEEQFATSYLADRMRAFVDLHPEFEDAVERFATWLARDDEDDE